MLFGANPIMPICGVEMLKALVSDAVRSSPATLEFDRTIAVGKGGPNTARNIELRCELNGRKSLISNGRPGASSPDGGRAPRCFSLLRHHRLRSSS